MPFAQRGRGIHRLIWIDPEGVEHFILLAFLGELVVWDGHVHQSIQIPRAVATSVAHAPTSVGATSIIDNVPVALSYSEASLPELVSAGVGPVAPTSLSTSQAYPPVLFADHTLDPPTALSTSQAYEPEVRVVFGVVPPVATSTSESYTPDVVADSAPVAPVATSTSDAHPPNVGALAIIEPPVATASSQALVPDISATALLTPPVATSTSSASVPVVSGSSTVEPPVATSTSQAYVPTVSAEVPFSRQRMDKSGSAAAGSGKVTGWVSDGTYPASVVSDALVVAVGGLATITASVGWSASFATGTFSIRRNGTQIAVSSTLGSGGTVTSGTATVTASNVTLAAGDTIELYRTGSLAVTTSTYVDVNPV